MTIPKITMEPKPLESDIFLYDEQNQTSSADSNKPFENHTQLINNSSEESNLYTIADDKEAWEAYLVSEQQWEEVYHRLANS